MSAEPLHAFERTQAALGARYRLERLVAVSAERGLFEASDLALRGDWPGVLALLERYRAEGGPEIPELISMESVWRARAPWCICSTLPRRSASRRRWSTVLSLPSLSSSLRPASRHWR